MVLPVLIVALTTACETRGRDLAADSMPDSRLPEAAATSPLQSLAGHKLGMVSFADDFVELHFEPPDDPSSVEIVFSVDDSNQSAAKDGASMPDDRPNALWASIRAYASPSITVDGRVARYPDPLAREALYSLVGRVVEKVIDANRDTLGLVLAGQATIRVPLRADATSRRPAAHFRRYGVTGIYR